MEKNRMKWGNSLMAYEEDIRNRTLLDWLKAHTSGFKPLHRYEGVFELYDNRIVFNGKDVKGGGRVYLEIFIKSILDLYLGWDEVFTGFPGSRAGDRAYPWNKPLRIRYRSEEGKKVIYLFVHFHYRWGIRTSDNKQVYTKLNEMLKRVKNMVDL